MEILKIIIAFSLIAATSVMGGESREENFSATSELYEKMLSGEPDLAKLTLFFRSMPKGGDLHHHYDGSIYAETYLEWVEKKGWYIDECTLRIVKERNSSDGCRHLNHSELLGDYALYRKALAHWSILDYATFSNIPRDSHFFNTFGYFAPIYDAYMAEGLQIIKKRARRENISYIESILARPGVWYTEYFDAKRIEELNAALRGAGSQEKVDAILDTITAELSRDERFEKSVASFVAKVEKAHEGIDESDFLMRYQTFAVRVFPPLQVYMELLSSHEAAERSPFIVGVNIVAPENNPTALRDYRLHMRMYNYLLRHYPKVHRALHAGELALGTVRPEELTFHMEDAVDIAGAHRIGHGVDLPYELDATRLLGKLKQRSAIEINFTSNDFILGVKGNTHPYTIYADYGVPLVISTDDSGVSRNDLTSQYVLLAKDYKPDYKHIKEYVYNSIRYSFLESREKERLIKQLDVKFELFEKHMAKFSAALR